MIGVTGVCRSVNTGAVCCMFSVTGVRTGTNESFCKCEAAGADLWFIVFHFNGFVQSAFRVRLNLLTPAHIWICSQCECVPGSVNSAAGEDVSVRGAETEHTLRSIGTHLNVLEDNLGSFVAQFIASKPDVFSSLCQTLNTFLQS